MDENRNLWPRQSPSPFGGADSATQCSLLCSSIGARRTSPPSLVARLRRCATGGARPCLTAATNAPKQPQSSARGVSPLAKPTPELRHEIEKIRAPLSVHGDEDSVKVVAFGPALRLAAPCGFWPRPSVRWSFDLRTSARSRHHHRHGAQGSRSREMCIVRPHQQPLRLHEMRVQDVRRLVRFLRRQGAEDLRLVRRSALPAVRSVI